MNVDLLQEADIATTGAILARAMNDDPAYGYMFPDTSTREAGLADLFRRNLRTHLPYRCTYVARDSSELVGTMTVRPPEGVPISLWTMFRSGMLSYLVRHGFDAGGRLLRCKSVYDALEDELADHALHWHVHMMAIRSDRQGKGLGSELLNEVFDRTVETRPEHAVVLTTHKEGNVVFYRRAGFDVVDERQASLPGGEPWTVWGMRRNPR